MTELNLAYGFNEEELVNNIPQKQIPQQQQMQQAPQQMPQQPQQLPPPQIIENSLYQQQQYNNNKSSQNISYSFWDRMVSTRGDVIKLAIFALVIVLGISFDRIATFYITKYLTDSEYTNLQEFIIRLSYPILIFIFLWIIKSL